MCGSNPTGGTKMNVIETLNANADKTPDEIVEALKPKPRETSFAEAFQTLDLSTLEPPS